MGAASSFAGKKEWLCYGEPTRVAERGAAPAVPRPHQPQSRHARNAQIEYYRAFDEAQLA